MDDAAIRDKYLELFSIRWDSPEIVEPLEKLRKQAEKAALDQWVGLIKARLLRHAKRFDDALEEVENVLQENPKNPYALFLRATLISETPERRAEAVSAYDAFESVHSAEQDLASRQLVAMALLNKGWTLGEMDRPREELGAYDDLIRRFGDSSEALLREQVAMALFNKACGLDQMDRPRDALGAYDDLIRRFGDSSEALVREQVAKALFNKGGTLAEMDKAREAPGVYDDLIRRFGDSPEARLREEVAKALFNKGMVLRRIGEPRDALAAFEEVLRRRKDLESEPLRWAVVSAQTMKAGLAKQLSTPEEADKAQAAALETVKGQYSETLRVYLEVLLAGFEPGTVKGYFAKMEARQDRTDEFLLTGSRFREDASCLLVLREWNSYTPAIPAEEERDRGGGYFIRHGGEGIVVDPGYDFIQNFHRAGGVLADIDHIIITHAHDDHTAELEAILMLRRQREQRIGRDGKPARVRLYLSEGAQRKFAGLIPLRGDRRIVSVTTLSRQASGSRQTIRLAEQVTVSVLAAYHDDALTRDTAVGLGFEFALADGAVRRVVFTGDSGYYPRKLTEDGTPEYYDPKTRQRPKVDCREELGLIRQYPQAFRQPDLLVAHIGSIRKEEFRPFEAVREFAGEADKPREEGEWYYVNHLGLLGTLTLLDKANARYAIISEFGAELRDFNIELVAKLGETLNEKQRRDQGEDAAQTFVIPGDVTMVYYMAEDRFLCHWDCTPRPSAELECRRCDTWDVRGRSREDAPDARRISTGGRAHLFPRDGDEAGQDKGIRDYYENLFALRLPHLKGP